MDYGALPPEINSGRMYTGPGAGTMLAAATAWDALAAELHRTAAAYGSTIEGLAMGPWLGPTSVAFAAAARPYVSWLTTTAAQAEHAASQAKLAGDAYETAFAATVPPPVIAINRAQLLSLIATNIFGQNTPAIAATEAEYMEMWAQDAGAMYVYAGSSAVASQLPPFTEPPQITTPCRTEAESTSMLSGLSTTASLPSWLTTDLANWNIIMAALTGPFSVQGWTSIPGGLFLSFGQLYSYGQNGQGLGSFFAPARPIAGALAPVAESIATHITAARSFDPVPSAVVGRAALVGNLSVPRGWTTVAPAIRSVAAMLSTSLAAPPAAPLNGESSVFEQMALSSLAGRALSATAVGSANNGVLTSSRGRVVEEADPAAAMIFVLPAEH